MSQFYLRAYHNLRVLLTPTTRIKRQPVHSMSAELHKQAAQSLQL